MSFRLFCLFAGLLLVIASCSPSLTEEQVRQIIAEEAGNNIPTVEQVRQVAQEEDQLAEDAILQAVRDLNAADQENAIQAVRQVMEEDRSLTEAFVTSLVLEIVVDGMLEQYDTEIAPMIQSQVDAALQRWGDEASAAGANTSESTDRIYAEVGEMVMRNNEVMLCPIEYWMTTIAIVTRDLIGHLGAGQPSLADIYDMLISGVDQEIYALFEGANCTMGTDGQWKWKGA